MSALPCPVCVERLDDAVPAVARSETLPVLRWRADRCSAESDELASEVAVALEYNGIAHAVMLATPDDLEDFAVGFSLSEGIVARAGEVLSVEVVPLASGIQLQLEITAARFALLKMQRRSLTGRTGCGLCGVESLEQVLRPLPPVQSTVRVAVAALHAAVARAEQPLQNRTGASHAALWIDVEQGLTCLREDVGRHNALDKLIGALARNPGAAGDVARGAAVITSRASHEMVQKAAAAGIGVLAAMSAPTSAAVHLAEQLNLTLIGFLRAGGKHVVYSHPQRLLEFSGFAGETR
jgi:FdhD protein